MGCCTSFEAPKTAAPGPPKRNFSLCILTWNVGGKSPNDKDLASLLNFESSVDGIHDNQPDMLVIGLQEIVDLNAKRLIKQNDHRMNKWESKIESILNKTDRDNNTNKQTKKTKQTTENDNNKNNVGNNMKTKYKYIKLTSHRLFGMLLMVFVSNHQTEFFSNSKNNQGISNILTSHIGTGLLNSGHNKGAVSITFKLFDFNFVFVNCHLAAHKDNLKGRTDDYNRIMSQLHFDPLLNRCKSIDYSFDNTKETETRENSRSHSHSGHANINHSPNHNANHAPTNISINATTTGNTNTNTAHPLTSTNNTNTTNNNSNNSSKIQYNVSIHIHDNRPTWSNRSSMDTEDNTVDVNRMVFGPMDGEVNNINNNNNNNKLTPMSPVKVTSPKLISMLKQRSMESSVGSQSEMSNNMGHGGHDTRTILDNDIIFVFGDLNYRLNYDISNKTDYNKVLQLIKIGFIDQLLENDQLMNEIKLGRVFNDFKEDKITFVPTFKYKPNSKNNEFSKKRIPSYCDRILWKTNYLNVTSDEMCLKRESNTLKYFEIDCIKYSSNMNQNMSDHKPVYAVFNCTCY